MDIYYPKDNAVSHGKVHEFLDPEALKRGEPLTEESIRWLLELQGEMYLVEQHYSTRTRSRRLALNGTPVAEFSDMEPIVDFQLGAANIRMCFTVRGNGVIYELFVDGKRFEDLTQALPSPIASRAEGSGMTFGAPLMSQRLGLLPPHLQQPVPTAPDHHQQQQQQQQQILALYPLDSSFSSLTMPLHPDPAAGTSTALVLLDDSFQGHHHHHHRRPSRRISISLTAGVPTGAHHRHDSSDLFAALANGNGNGNGGGGAVGPALITSTITTSTTTGTTAGTTTSTSSSQGVLALAHHHQHHQQHHHVNFMGTPETTAAAGTPTTIALSSTEAGSGSYSGQGQGQGRGGAGWADMMIGLDGSTPSFLVTASFHQHQQPPHQYHQQQEQPQQQQQLVPHPLASPAGTDGFGFGAALRGESAMVVVGGEQLQQATGTNSVHGAGLLLRSSVEELYFSSDDEGGANAAPQQQAMVVAAGLAPAPGAGAGKAAGGSRAARRRRGTTAEFFLEEDDDDEAVSAAAAMAMDTGAAAAAGGNRVVLPAFKVAKTSAAARPATGMGMGMGTQHGSMPNLLQAAAAERQGEGQQQQQEPAGTKRRGFEHVLLEEEMGPGKPGAIQRSLSASDVMGRPPNLKIMVPAPPTTLNCTALLQRTLRRGAAGARGVQPPQCRPR